MADDLQLLCYCSFRLVLKPSVFKHISYPILTKRTSLTGSVLCDEKLIFDFETAMHFLRFSLRLLLFILVPCVTVNRKHTFSRP